MRALCLICVFLLLGVRLHGGTPQESGFLDSFVENGLEEPTSIAWAPDGSSRLFVTLKNASVRVIRNGVLQRVPFASFGRIHTSGECGLLGLCFDPEYLSNGWVYVFVTVSASEQRIVRFTDLASVGVARTSIISRLPTAGGIHNGGAIGCGSDGKLYWAIGDNGVKRGVDADLRTLAAKVGRANRDGSVPNDNPFFDGAGKRNDFIWATGFRNPFSLTFQPRTGALWLNVVGSDSGGQTVPNSGPGYEQVFIVRPGDDAGYDDYEGNQPDEPRFMRPFARALAHPVIQYKTGQSRSGFERQIESIQFDLSAGGARVVTSGAHECRAGQAIIISNTGTFDGDHVVQRVSSPTELIMASEPTDLIAHGGKIQPLAQGSCVVGGSFYEASAFPESLRGNFIYADYASGRIMRARLDGENRPVEIRMFVSDARSPIDTAVGPDGALYYAEFATGSIRKVVWKNAEQALLIAPTFLNMREGARARISVSLRRAPATDLLVTAQRAAGDAELTILDGETLRFTAENWDKPQMVTIGAAVDEDSANAEATLVVRTAGVPLEHVQVSVTDITRDVPIVSPSVLEIAEGAEGQFAVSLPRPPHRAVTMTIRGNDPRGVQLVGPRSFIFTPENYAVPRTVRVRARDDANDRNEVTRLIIKTTGFDTRELTATAIDDDPSPPEFTSAPRPTAIIGMPFSGVVRASGVPAPTYSLIDGPLGMTIDAQNGTISWAPSELGEFDFVVRAENGNAPAAEARFSVVVEADQPPAAFLNAPAERHVVRATGNLSVRSK